MVVKRKPRPRKIADLKIFKKFGEYLATRKDIVLITVFLTIIAVGLELLAPYIYGQTMDTIGKSSFSYKNVLISIALYLAVMFCAYFVVFMQNFFLQESGEDIIFSLRGALFEKAATLSPEQTDKMLVGEMVTRVTSDTEALNLVFTDIFINLLRNTLTITGIIIVMFILSVKLALAVLVAVPVFIIATLTFKQLSRHVYRQVRQNVTNINAFLSENFIGIKVIQAFNQEEAKISEFKALNKALNKSLLKQVYMFGVFRPFIASLYTLTFALVLWIGAKEALLAGSASVLILITFREFINRLFNPLQRLAEDLDQLQAAIASSERIFDFLAVAPALRERPEPVQLTPLRGSVEFRNVWFKYENDESWVLEDVSFSIPAGATVAFVGLTGSGKSTILKLITRHYDVTRGTILIDGVDIKDLDLKTYLSQVGQMMQDVFLFSGTIAENISLGNSAITEAKIRQACADVNAAEFIENLPKGYNSPVLERGSNFSRGEQQLLSFARTMAIDPKMMILDEATSNIDTQTDLLIQDSLAKMMKKGTMIMVAHRLSTIKKADCIYVIDKGRLVESGTHEQLVAAKGMYYYLYILQS